MGRFGRGGGRGLGWGGQGTKMKIQKKKIFFFFFWGGGGGGGVRSGGGLGG